MAGPAPTIEVIIRDEVSAALERQRQRLRHIDSQTTFKGLRGAFKGLEDNVTRVGEVVRREMGSLVRLTGAGGFLGGGLVAGIAKATQALAGMARASEQTRYLADDLGLTVAQLEKLTARGRALGMSSEQSRSGLTTLAKHMSELKVLGNQASIYKELARSGGESGRLFGDRLIRSVRGPGGIEAGLREYSRSVGNMNQDAARKATELFGAGSLGFRDLFSKELDGLPHILELPEGAAKRLNVAMAALNISFDNIKKTIGGAVMPAFEQLARGLDRFLQGPGAGIVKMFADWVKSLHIDWAAVARGFGTAIEFLKTVFVEVKKAFDAADPIVQGMGGWTTVLGTLAVAVGIGGLAGELVLVARGFAAIGKLGGVIALVAGIVAVAAPTTAGAMQLPEVSVTPPAPRTRMPHPRPQSAPGGGGTGGTDIPANAKPTSGGPGGQGYYIPGQQGGDDNDELKQQVRAARVQVASLSSYFSAQGANTDESGAGGLAGFGGPLKRLGAPMGGAPGGGGGVPGGGGGGRAPRGGGGGGRRGGGGRVGGGPIAMPQDDPRTTGNPYLSSVRAAQIAEINGNPALKKLFFQLVEHENGGGGPASLATMEILLARARMLKLSVKQEMFSRRWGPINQGTAARVNLSAQQWANYERALQLLGGGSNWSKSRTDSGMRGDPNYNGPGNIPVPGSSDHFNFFSGWHGGPQGSAAFAAEEQRRAREAGDTPLPPGTATPPPAASAQPQAAVPPPPSGSGGESRVRQSQAGTRHGEVDPRLENVLHSAAAAAGIYVDVYSGGQRMPGVRGAKGSHRHDLGLAADHTLLDEHGNQISRDDPRRLKYIEEVVARGGGGMGLGYMNDPRSIHAGLTGRVGGERGVGNDLFLYNAGRATPAERAAYAAGMRRYQQDRPTLAARQPPSYLPPSPIVWSNQPDIDALKSPLSTPRSRAGGINLKINVRGPRGVTVASDSDGAVSPAAISRTFSERARASRHRGTAESHDASLDS